MLIGTYRLINNAILQATASIAYGSMVPIRK